MKSVAVNLVLLLAAGLLAGCGTVRREGLDPVRLREVQGGFTDGGPKLSAELGRQILSLDPTNVTEREIREVLARAPAPRVINIHGGVEKVIKHMASFSGFLIGMGYPGASLTNPADGTYSFSCYVNAEKIAGMIAWYYEKEGLRPMMVGHSQGGMQVVKVLHKLAAKPSSRIRVWSPLTWKEEGRTEIRDPLTGQMRPVVGLRLPYSSSVGAGGLTRLLPNQWDMTWRLRSIPDSVEEFTGFCMEFDLLGGDWLGYGAANEYEATGSAAVRNVWLPTEYNHGKIPGTKHLLDDPQMVEWIHRYRPEGKSVSRPAVGQEFDGDSSNILWAAEVWFDIKKHWVLELQRLIRAQQANTHDR